MNNFTEIKLCNNKLNIMVAFTREKKIIGQGMKLPWGRLNADRLFMLWAIKTGSNGTIIMGRKTSEVARFPKIKKIIVSQTKEGDCYVKKFEDGIQKCTSPIIVMGGEGIYKEALQYQCRIFCTIIEDEDWIKGDIFFPITFTNNKCLNKIYIDPNKMINITELVIKDILIEGEGSWIIKNGWIIENNCKFQFYMYDK